MVQAEIDLRVIRQRFSDRQREMLACRAAQAAKTTAPAQFDLLARLQALGGNLRPSTSPAGTAGATS